MIRLVRKLCEKIYLGKERLRLRNHSFSIISSNCWGGRIYQDLNVQYQSPTVGVFFYAPCFIKLLENLEENINQPLKFKTNSQYFEANEDREKSNILYPIGILNDNIEIHFLHYESEAEAREKWTERCKRIVWDNLFIAFTDRDRCTAKEQKLFDNLPFKNKVQFVSQPSILWPSMVKLVDFKDHDQIGNIYTNPKHYRKDFNVVDWLNSA